MSLFHNMLRRQAASVGGGACLRNLMYVGSSPSSQIPGSFLTWRILLRDSVVTGSLLCKALNVASSSAQRAWLDRGRTLSLSSLRNVWNRSANSLFLSASDMVFCILAWPRMGASLLLRGEQIFRGWTSTRNLKMKHPLRFFTFHECVANFTWEYSHHQKVFSLSDIVWTCLPTDWTQWQS